MNTLELSIDASFATGREMLWDDPNPATAQVGEYRIERADVGQENWTPLATVTEPRWTIKLAQGPHRLRVTAYGKDGASRPSSGLTIIPTMSVEHERIQTKGS